MLHVNFDFFCPLLTCFKSFHTIHYILIFLLNIQTNSCMTNINTPWCPIWCVIIAQNIHWANILYFLSSQFTVKGSCLLFFRINAPFCCDKPKSLWTLEVFVYILTTYQTFYDWIFCFSTWYKVLISYIFCYMLIMYINVYIYFLFQYLNSSKNVNIFHYSLFIVYTYVAACQYSFFVLSSLKLNEPKPWVTTSMPSGHQICFCYLLIC